MTTHYNSTDSDRCVEWRVLAPFAAGGVTWLSHFVPEPHRLTMVPREVEEVSWHRKTKPVTSFREWRNLAKELRIGLRGRRFGVITVFPQLAALAGFYKRVRRGKWPLVAYWFDTAEYSGWRRSVARFALRSVDVFVVHSRGEIATYARWLGLPEERFVFIPLQKPELFDLEVASRTEELIFATGSGRRDYATFFEAVRDLSCRVVVAPGVHAVQGLDVPDNVEIRFEITKQEILELSQSAKVNVVPMNNEGPIAGTVTIVEAMRLGGAIVATDRTGISDYLRQGETALLVPPGDASALRLAIEQVLEDSDTRDRLGGNAFKYANEHLSDEAAGASLGELLDRFVPATDDD